MGMIKFKAPALPLATEKYDVGQQAQVIRALRLYFSQLDSRTGIEHDLFQGGDFVGDNFTGGLFTGEGRGLKLPFGAIQDTTSQYASAINTPTQVKFDTTDFVNEVVHVPNDGLTAVYSGIYNYQFSIQLANTATQIHEATIWLKKRAAGVSTSTNIPGTGSVFSIPNKHGAVDGYLTAAVNFYVTLNAGETVELWWQANAVENGISNGIYIEAYAATATLPSIPSAVATLSFVSAVP